ncbi:hypothetical protein [Nitrospirillum sp. BR 11163]|uniref:hypothetical protein n=1 Tax=Nitrospirillum sp. BR 11163 TaxID=3104323 RepID=UPI002AFE36AA|nr:hypothetical protein [Nitrospirillum sp. BR 11163]MEA1672914.1 hypothetical protein [Nitrospirillum sp. BR 11163]
MDLGWRHAKEDFVLLISDKAGPLQRGIGPRRKSARNAEFKKGEAVPAGGTGRFRFRLALTTLDAGAKAGPIAVLDRYGAYVSVEGYGANVVRITM